MPTASSFRPADELLDPSPPIAGQSRAPQPAGEGRPGRAPAAGARCALAAVALAGLLAGCSSERDVLARVDGTAISVEQFNEVARDSPQQYPGPPDSAKARLLDGLVVRALLLHAARGEGLHEAPEFAAFRTTVERQVLRETLLQRLLGGPFPVSEAEVAELFRRRASATRARLIFTFHEPLILQAQRDLARGNDFAAVADRYNPAGIVPPGGDIGFIQAGALLGPLDDIVRTGAVGRVHGPVSAGGQGWFLVRIEERRPQPQPPLEEVRDDLRAMLRQRKQRAASERAVEALRADYRLIVEQGAAQAMVARLRAAPGAGGELQRPPPPGPEERRLVLARYQGGSFTLGEAYDDLVGGAASPPDLAMLPAVERWIESRALERVVLAEAQRRRLNEEPLVRRRIGERLDNFLLDGYYQRHVIERIRIGPQELAVAYRRFRESFSRLLSARVISVTLADSAAAAALASQAGRVPSLGEAAATAGAAAAVREEQLTFPADSPLWTRFQPQLEGMKPGEIAGPFPLESGWIVFQLREKQQDAPPMDNLEGGALMQLQGVATEIQREARLQALTDSLRRAHGPIVVHRERLARLPWPPAPAAPAGG